MHGIIFSASKDLQGPILKSRKAVVMTKRISRRFAAVLAMVMLITSFAATIPVNAAGKADMKKANVKWDLKNNKTLKYKTKWSEVGTKTHTVKMTNYKVKNAKKKGYKQCTFTLTYTRNLKLTKKQRNNMLDFACGGPEFVSPGGEFYYTVVDYKTGKCLEKSNKQKVKVTRSKWKYSNWTKISDGHGSWFEYAKKATVNVKIVYPKKYKNLAIGVGGYTKAPYAHSDITVGGGAASATYEIVTPNANKFYKGKKAFSDETLLYSKKDKSYAHFMRVK